MTNAPICDTIKKTKEVNTMTEIIKYIADDGTEFDDEQECVEYEFSCNAESMEGRVWLFDSRQRSATRHIRR